MSDPRNEKLEQLLRSRGLEAAGPDLAERIIAKARTLPQRKNIPFWQSIKDLCAEFHLPQPAYVVAAALIVGIVLGFSAPEDTTTAGDDDAPMVQGFLSADEVPL